MSAPYTINQKSLDYLVKKIQQEERDGIFNEHQHFVAPHGRFMRDEFIKHKANPNLFEIRTAEGQSLNVYIFESVHSWTRQILPPHIRCFLECIALQDGSTFIGEVAGDYHGESDSLKPEVIFHPALFLDKGVVDQQIETEMAEYKKYNAQYYTVDREYEWKKSCREDREKKTKKYKEDPDFLGDDAAVEQQVEMEMKGDKELHDEVFAQYYINRENEWKESCRKEREKITKKYKEWPDSLSDDAKKYLKKKAPKGISLEDVNPHTLSLLLSMKLTLKEGEDISSVQRVSLDGQVEALFCHYGRKMKKLDTKALRKKAELEDIFSRESKRFDFDQFVSYIERINERASKLLAFQNTYAENVTLIEPTLDDMDFSCPITLEVITGGHYFAGYSNGEDIKMRNGTWWEETIFPLLNTQLNLLQKGRKLKHTLIMYGQMHSDFEHGILHRIKEEGLQLLKLHRNGFALFEETPYLFPDNENKQTTSSPTGFSLETDRLFAKNFSKIPTDTLFR